MSPPHTTMGRAQLKLLDIVECTAQFEKWASSALFSRYPKFA